MEVPLIEKCLQVFVASITGVKLTAVCHQMYSRAQNVNRAIPSNNAYQAASVANLTTFQRCRAENREQAIAFAQEC